MAPLPFLDDNRSMNRTLRPLHYGLLAAGSLLVAWVGLFFLPTGAYERYAGVIDTDYIKCSWVYERLNFDPTPVDIAFIGSSRTMEGINGSAVEAGLKAAGYDAHVVNFGIPSLGLDVPYLLTKMLVETKRPRIVFVETDYLAYSETNPAFPLLATPEEILHAPLIVNEWLLNDLIGVAGRNLNLTWKRLVRGPEKFDPATYRGAHWEDVDHVTAHGGIRGPLRQSNMEKAAFESYAAWWVGNIVRKAGQYDAWAWVQLRYAETYRMRMLRQLQASGAKIVFLSMPAVGTPEPPYHFDRLRPFGSFWPLPDVVSRDYTLWDNPTHMNSRGARIYSAWLVEQLRGATQLGALQPRAGDAHTRN